MSVAPEFSANDARPQDHSGWIKLMGTTAPIAYARGPR